MQITYSVADYARKVKRATSKTIWLDGPQARTVPVQDVSDVRLSATSPSGELEAVLRETADKKRIVEIWRAGQLDVSHDVTDAHDAFYNDGKPVTINCIFLSTDILLSAIRHAAILPIRDCSGLRSRSKDTQSDGSGVQQV